MNDKTLDLIAKYRKLDKNNYTVLANEIINVLKSSKLGDSQIRKIVASFSGIDKAKQGEFKDNTEAIQTLHKISQALVECISNSDIDKMEERIIRKYIEDAYKGV